MGSLAAKEKPTFTTLPPEIRNRIYEFSGCLKVKQFSTQPTLVEGNYPDGEPYSITIPSCHEWCFPDRFALPDHQPLSLWVNRDWKRGLDELHYYFFKDKNCFPGDNKRLRKPSTLCDKKRGSAVSSHAKFHTDGIAQPSLTLVNKQIRTETLPVFYGAQSFLFTLFDREAESKSLLKWLKKIGKTNASRIRTFKIVYRKKKDRAYIQEKLIPSMKKLGVRTGSKEGVVMAIRIGYPFCYCEGCIRNLLGEC